jgi:hypothetical protein
MAAPISIRLPPAAQLANGVRDETRVEWARGGRRGSDGGDAVSFRSVGRAVHRGKTMAILIAGTPIASLVVYKPDRHGCS